MSNAERLGSDLAEVASWAVVSGTVQATLREGRELSKAVAKLTLFGDDANLKIRAGDPLPVQVLKQMTKDYLMLRAREAEQEDPDGRAANDLLVNIGRQLTALETTKTNHLMTSLKLLVEQAKLQAKSSEKGGSPTASDLEEMIRKNDARGVIRSAMVVGEDEE